MRAIDAWVNVQMPARPAPWQERVAQDLFKKPAAEVFRNRSMEEIVATMDQLGIERALLTVIAERPSPTVLKFSETHPSRFALAAHIDPRRGMKALRELEALAKSQPIAVAQLIPCMLNLPPDDRACYPLYAKCVELGLPVSVNTGIPGPPLPGRCQHPLHLDDVCLFFPELTVVMANGADPWWGVAIRLMLKYPKLHLMTSAWSPKYLPAELIAYLNTRGQEKIVFATDFPFIAQERALEEARALDLREGVLDKYLYANARRLFFDRS